MKSSKSIVEEYLKKQDWRVKENSNSPFSFGGLGKYITGEVSKDYWLRNVYTEDIANAYIKNYIHLHDLGGLTLYCCGYSLKDILLKGVRGIPNVPTSAPAKHFDSTLNQIANLTTIYQNEIMGAVAFNSFDTLLAPFIKVDKLTYREVKQSMQNYIFSINSNSRAGAEPAFSNMTFDLTPPDDLLDEYAVVGGELVSFTYRSCQQEMDMLNRAFFEIMLEGDSEGKLFAYPIPTYNIHKRFDWDNPNNKLLWELAGKYGTPYFANFLNSELEPSDVRSMALLSSQNIIYKKEDGTISQNELGKLVDIWKSAPKDLKPKYKILMNGNFVDCTEMFKIDYKEYNNQYQFVTLDNGYKQNFSIDHKCAVLDKNGEIKTKLSQDIKVGDNFIIAKNSWGNNNGIGDYESGLIIGYYLAEGWKTHEKEINFAINIKREDIVDKIVKFFNKIGCKTKIDKQTENNIIKVFVFGSTGKGYVEQFVNGDKAITKRLSNNIWNTDDNFRMGVFDGYYDTDGCPTHSIFAHTTNKLLCNDLITLASSLGKILKYRVNKNNTRSFNGGKKERFTSYELKLFDYPIIGDYYIVPVKNSQTKISNIEINNVYNFTVNTKDHLFELPNGIISHQCCRLRLDLTELRKRNGGLFGAGDSTGSIGVVTINLPRIGYETKGDRQAFFYQLNKYLNIAKDSLMIKREWLQKNIIETNAIPAYIEYVGTLRNHFSTIGIVGMNEMCENFMGVNIVDKHGKQFALEVGDYIRNKLVEFQEECGCLFNYEATPAESTCYRLALNDKKAYPDIITQGSGKDCYYTNSCQIPVSLITSINETFKHQEELQCQFTGGTVIHCYLEGAISGEQARDIVKGMLTEYKVPYMSLSPISRYCDEHGYVKEITDKCPICKKKLKLYQRITGYLRCIDNFNRGKKAEFKDRKQLNINAH